jgi:hypothetical protein
MRLAGSLCEDPSTEQWAIAAIVEAAQDIIRGVGATGDGMLDLWIENPETGSGKRVVGSEDRPR